MWHSCVQGVFREIDMRDNWGPGIRGPHRVRKKIVRDEISRFDVAPEVVYALTGLCWPRVVLCGGVLFRNY